MTEQKWNEENLKALNRKEQLKIIKNMGLEAKSRMREAELIELILNAQEQLEGETVEKESIEVINVETSFDEYVEKLKEKYDDFLELDSTIQLTCKYCGRYINVPKDRANCHLCGTPFY